MAGPIQSGINNILNMGAAAATLSGAVAERRETDKLNQMIDTARAKSKSLSETVKDPKTSQIDRDVAIETVGELDKKIQGARDRIFDINPTEENLDSIMEGKKKALNNQNFIQRANYDISEVEAEAARQADFQEEMNQQMEQGYTPNDEARAEQANNRAATQQATKKKRRNFMRDYLSQMQTNMGGKVGDMAPELQKKIAANYSPKERQRIMNQKDKEKGGKK